MFGAVEIQLPAYAHGHIHPVIHPMYLKLASRRSVQKGFRALIERHFNREYEVDTILAHRGEKDEMDHPLVRSSHAPPRDLELLRTTEFQLPV